MLVLAKNHMLFNVNFIKLKQLWRCVNGYNNGAEDSG